MLSLSVPVLIAIVLLALIAGFIVGAIAVAIVAAQMVRDTPLAKPALRRVI